MASALRLPLILLNMHKQTLLIRRNSGPFLRQQLLHQCLVNLLPNGLSHTEASDWMFKGYSDIVLPPPNYKTALESCHGEGVGTTSMCMIKKHNMIPALDAHAVNAEVKLIQ